MVEPTKRSAALAERLQRLKAGSDRSRSSAAAVAASDSKGSAPRVAASRPLPSVNSVPASTTSRSSRSPSEDFEHLPQISTEHKLSEKLSPSQGIGPEQQEMLSTEGEGEFEMVSSPPEVANRPSECSSSLREESAGREGETLSNSLSADPNEQEASGAAVSIEVADLRKQLSEEREHRHDLSAQIIALRGAYVEVRDSREAANEDVKRLLEEVSSLRQKLQEATSLSLKQARQEEASNVSRRLERAELAIEQERTAALKLEQQLSVYRKQAEDGAESARQLIKLQEKLREASQRAATSESELKASQQSSALQAQQIEQLKEQNLHLKHQSELAAASPQQAGLGAMPHTSDMSHAALHGLPKGVHYPSAVLTSELTDPPASDIQQQEASRGPALEEHQVFASSARQETEGLSPESPVLFAPSMPSSGIAEERQTASSLAEQERGHPVESSSEQSSGWGLWAYISGADKALSSKAQLSS